MHTRTTLRDVWFVGELFSKCMCTVHRTDFEERLLDEMTSSSDTELALTSRQSALLRRRFDELNTAVRQRHREDKLHRKQNGNDRPSASRSSSRRRSHHRKSSSSSHLSPSPSVSYNIASYNSQRELIF